MIKVGGPQIGLFQAEAEGLPALRATGHLATPDVLAVSSRLLLLQALIARDDSQRSWETFAYDLAAPHSGTVHDRSGWASDGCAAPR